MPLIPITPDHPLHGVVLKIDRAREHLDELDREVSKFLRRDLYSAEPRYEPEHNCWVLAFRLVVAPPARFGIVVGDIVHNLRASLDYLICQLALLDGSGRGCDESPRTQFPIVSSERQWEQKNTQRMVERLPDDVRSIVESMQPYHSEQPQEHPLSVLRDLSNADKHRNVNSTPLAIEFDVKSTWERSFKDATVEFRIPSDDYVVWDLEQELVATIAFGLDGPGAGADVRNLRGVHQMILDEVLPSFVGFFP